MHKLFSKLLSLLPCVTYGFLFISIWLLFSKVGNIPGCQKVIEHSNANLWEVIACDFPHFEQQSVDACEGIMSIIPMAMYYLCYLRKESVFFPVGFLPTCTSVENCDSLAAPSQSKTSGLHTTNWQQLPIYYTKNQAAGKNLSTQCCTRWCIVSLLAKTLLTFPVHWREALIIDYSGTLLN